MNLTDIIERWNVRDPEALAARASEVLPFWVSLLLVLLLGYYIARMVWLLVPGAPSTPWVPPPSLAGAQQAGANAPVQIRTASRIAATHLFGTADPAEPDAQAISAEDAPETQLNLQLRGVVAAADERFAHAIIADASGTEKVYFIKDPVPGGATLRAIQADRVLLGRGSSIEALLLPRDAATGAAAPSPRPTAALSGRLPTRSMQDVVTQNASSFTEIIRPQPFMPNGELKGYRVYPGRSREQFTALGLQPGDLVTEINGMTLNNPAQAMELFRSLADTTQVTMTVEREGQAQTLTLDTTQVAAAGGATE